MINKFLFFLLACAGLLVSSCRKEPGVGGDASIQGRVWVRHYNSTFTTFIGEYPGDDQYVYIIYGEHPGYDARLKTSYDGTFRFQYLNPGKYQLYVYSLDSTLTSLNNTVPVIRDVEISSRKQEVDLGDIVIYK